MPVMEKIERIRPVRAIPESPDRPTALAKLIIEQVALQKTLALNDHIEVRWTPVVNVDSSAIEFPFVGRDPRVRPDRVNVRKHRALERPILRSGQLTGHCAEFWPRRPWAMHDCSDVAALATTLASFYHRQPQRFFHHNS